MSRKPIVRKPIITEKTTKMTDALRQVAFRVDQEASKPEIKKAVEALFHVQVETVRTLNMPGKVRRRGRSVGRRPGWKKAIVQLQAGQSIDFLAAAMEA